MKPDADYNVEEIANLNKKYPDIHILAGVEMDILPDGKLDFSDAFLQELDFVIAAIHSSFNQTEEQIMLSVINCIRKSLCFVDCSSNRKVNWQTTWLSS